MPLLIPRRRVWQPQGALPEIAADTLWADRFVCGGVGGFPLYINGTGPVAQTASAPFKDTALGVASRGYAGSTQQIAKAITTTSDITLLVIGEVNTSTSANSCIYTLSHNGASDTFGISTSDGTTAGKIVGRVYLGGYRTIGGSTTLANGDLFTAVLRHRHNTSQELWLNGIKDASTGAWTGSTVGNQYFGQYSSGGMNYGILGLVWNRALSDDEIVALSANPWQVFTPRRAWVPVSAGGGTTVAVPAASLTLTGHSPTVLTPRTVSVPAAALSLSAYAPTVQTPRTVAVPSASVTLTGFAPVVVTPRTISVPAASLTLTGYAPTVATTATIAVPAATLTLAAYAPTVSNGAGVTVSVPAASLTLSAYAPTVYTYGSQTESVFYFPLRLFATGSSGAVDATVDLDNLRSLLPRQQQRAINPDGTLAAPWYRFFDFDVNVVRGGPSAPTMADVQAAIEEALAAIQQQQQTTALLAQTVITNAEALAATREVVQNNSLTGSEAIPAVSRTYMEP